MNESDSTSAPTMEAELEAEIAAHRAKLRNLRLAYAPCVLATLWLVYDQGLTEGRWWPVLAALAVFLPFGAYIANVGAQANLARLRLWRLRRG